MRCFADLSQDVNIRAFYLLETAVGFWLCNTAQDGQYEENKGRFHRLVKYKLKK